MDAKTTSFGLNIRDDVRDGMTSDVQSVRCVVPVIHSIDVKLPG